MKIEYSTTANCPPAQVWAVFSDVQSWSRWNPLATAAWIEGEPWQQGSQLALQPAQPQVKVKAKIVDTAPPNSVRWQGSAMGVSFQQSFDFSAQTDGTTLMKTQLDLSGAATFFISNKMKQQGIDLFARWFKAMKAEAENRSISGVAPPL